MKVKILSQVIILKMMIQAIVLMAVKIMGKTFYLYKTITSVMKKLVLGVLMLVMGTSFAQQEIKVNVTDALALKTLTVSYEHYATEQTSVGVSGLFNFESDCCCLSFLELNYFSASISNDE